MRGMPHSYWPVHNLVLRTGDVTLRANTEADLVPLSELCPADVETNPHLPDFGVPGHRAAHAIHQGYWRSMGSWEPGTWSAGFTVWVSGELAGFQDLEAADFGALRTVETASWLGTAFRGKGIGKAMRLAVLSLAFDGLGAEVAETEAWTHNASSLGVSRALGYVDNGVKLHRHQDSVAEMARMRLTRQRWSELHTGHDVTIEGLDTCRHMF
ncbi:GNAT family N-acetyltransferase [Longispora albida]|uniref:GNAT family N-acetyltransferase n=1 Tax=Longispora albida TaxID=203523 RepID=UPI00036C96B2|nr:GNAT family protein [Longispora albida]